MSAPGPLEDVDVHVGQVRDDDGAEREEDLASLDDGEDNDPDDDELEETPADVVMVLGFDPLEADEDDFDDAPPTKAAAAALLRAFDESQHERDESGKFASGGGGGAETKDDDESGSTFDDEATLPPPRKMRQELDALVERLGKPDGGFTYSPTTGDQPTTGYAVSAHKDREHVVDARSLTQKEIVRYYIRNRDLLRKRGNFIGAWNDPESGKVFFDVSTVVKDAAEAERIGREARQLAYFDLSGGKSVSIEERAS